MARLGAGEIYLLAREAGFSPDEAVTMTAIALAESGGETGAHNQSGEDSRGLWQINFDAHADRMAHLDFDDPLDQARAAFLVSGEGADISPWTVTHESKGARYLRHRAEAEAAAAAAGEAGAHGQWEPPSGYGDRVAASPDGPSPFDDDGLPGGLDLAQLSVDDGPTVEAFLAHALGQDGKPYVFGAEADGQADPNAFDCSELVQWAANQVGLNDMRDGTWYQYNWLKEQDMLIPVEDAVNIPGALLYRFDHEPHPNESPHVGHVAISLGDGTTIEAKGRAYGTGVFEAGERFQYAALVPGLDYSGAGGVDSDLLRDRADQVSDALVAEPDVDSDHDLLGDRFEARMGLDPDDPDTDGDGITDGYELLALGTSALRADSDYDGLADDIEIGLGLDPTVMDNPDLDADVGPIGEWTDADGNGVVDWYEEVLSLGDDNPLGDDDALGDDDGFGGDDPSPLDDLLDGGDRLPLDDGPIEIDPGLMSS